MEKGFWSALSLFLPVVRDGQAWGGEATRVDYSIIFFYDGIQPRNGYRE